MKPFDLLSNAVRAKEIFSVLARYGFGELLDQIELPPGFWRRIVPQPRQHLSPWQRIRMALEELGPTFVKFGQLLSMRPDAIPQPLVLELRKLQNSVKVEPFAELKPILIAELGDELETIFSEFDETPVAAASLAQVYFARLKSDGRPVAIKIQRPKIDRIIEADLGLAGWLANQLHQRITTLQPYALPDVVEEVSTAIARELDFRNEARNQQYFNATNPHPEKVFAPDVIGELSGERVLVMERIDGLPVTSPKLTPELAQSVAANGAASLLRQMLVVGFFHADPHAGNVIVMQDGRLCFLDWGLVGHLTKRLRHGLADFWLAAVNQDAERIVQIAADLAPPGGTYDLRTMERDVTLALREELNFSIGRQELGRAMLRLLFVFGENGIHLSRDYSLMAKAVLAIEEVGRALDPKFDLRQQARPVMRELYTERNGPRALAKRIREFMTTSVQALNDMPSELRRLVRKLDTNSLTLNVQHHGLEDIDDALESASSRITLGVIIGSLLIGSSLIVTTGIKPHLFGYPALGIIGYLLSAIMGLYVIWDIFRRGGHR